mmetsp:Transcript_52060/g.127094  ORF Transcript_52060/g.127094 Transcript_52060/m.127094 type:complete len:615 (+) Transcript_52060:171-2015(+)
MSGAAVGISEEDRLARLAEIRRKAEQDKRARQNIQREREADQTYRSARSGAVGAGSQTASPAPAAPTPPKEHQRCVVQLCLPSGERAREEFSSGAKLSDVHMLAKTLLEREGVMEDFDLISPPRKVIAEQDLGQTLLEADCVPGVSFTVRPKSNEGVISTTLAAGTDFEQAFVAEVRWMLREDGLLAFEAEAWASHVEGQLRRGEMHPLRAGLKALFGGRPLPQVVRGWMQRIEKAPRPQGAPIPKEACARMLHEFETLSQNERDALGFSMKGGERGDVLVVTMSKLPPDSALARDLASAECGSSMLVLEMQLGSNFPFQAPAIRILSPPMTPMPGSTSEAGRRASVVMEGGEKAVGLEGGKAASWSMHWAASAFRLLSWSRNWIVGSAARLDKAAVGEGRQWNSPPSSCALWQEFGVVDCEAGAETDDDPWDIDLPPSARALLSNEKGEKADAMKVSEQDSGSNADAMEVEVRNLVEEGFVEVSFRKRRAVCSALRFTAPEGSVRMSPSFLARLLPDQDEGGSPGDRVVIRSVALGRALDVAYNATAPALVNALRHTAGDVPEAFRKATRGCQAGDKVDIFIGGRNVEVLVVSVKGETSCCALTDETRFVMAT